MSHGDRARAKGNFMGRHDLYSRRASTGKTTGWQLDRAAKTRTHRVERRAAKELTLAQRLKPLLPDDWQRQGEDWT